jgi:hypothetical protein
MGNNATDMIGVLFLVAGTKRERFTASTAASVK